MGLWITLVVGVGLGMAGGGRAAIRAARAGNFPAAHAALATARVVAAGCGMLAAAMTLGWPFKDVTSTVPVEVARTVVEAVSVPSWFFWTATESRQRVVRETAYRSTTSRQFSPWLVLPLLGVGWACSRGELWLVRRAWARG